MDEWDESTSKQDKLNYICSKLSLKFGLVYCYMLLNKEEAEQMYARATNELLDVLDSIQEEPDFCFDVFKDALTQWHTGYHTIKGGLSDSVPCQFAALKFRMKGITTDKSIASNVTSLVPLRMSKFNTDK